MLPAPSRGLIVRHCYLFHQDQEDGHEVSDDPHPVVIVSVQSGRVLALVITHSPPQSDAAAVEIPAEVKAASGLDEHRQWVVVNEANLFTWPGPDLRTISGSNPPSPVYGTMPTDFLREVASAYMACQRGDPTGAKTVERA